MLLSTGPPFCLHILHCHSKGLSRNWADFWNLKCEYLPNYWSDLSEINCDGFSFKSPLIWYTSFSQRHKAIFGCCIATYTELSKHHASTYTDSQNQPMGLLGKQSPHFFHFFLKQRKKKELKKATKSTS